MSEASFILVKFTYLALAKKTGRATFHHFHFPEALKPLSLLYLANFALFARGCHFLYSRARFKLCFHCNSTLTNVEELENTQLFDIAIYQRLSLFFVEDS